MDPAIQTVLLGLLTNGLTPMIAFVLKKGGENVIGKEFLEEQKRIRKSIEPIFNKAFNDLVDTVTWQGGPKIEVVCLFLLSPEAQMVIRQLFSIETITISLESKDSSGITQVREEFLNYFTLLVSSYSKHPKSQLNQIANNLFDVLVDMCNKALEGVLNDDELAISALDARSSYRFQVLRDEVAGISSTLKLLVDHEIVSHKKILNFEKEFRSDVERRNGVITLPDLDRKRKVAINDIYVQPDLELISYSNDGNVKKDKQVVRLTYNEFLKSFYRSVILGNPGGGKSTLVAKICHELASESGEGTFSGRKITPIQISLFDYGKSKKGLNCSIVDYIAQKAYESNQLPKLAGVFEYLLLSGRSIVIFDGLDELIDTTQRQEITESIESFCARYPSVPVLVTSREVGYEQAPLDERRFEIYRLAPFNQEQIKDYISKWFCIEAELKGEELNQTSNGFIKDCKNVPDLCSNPLMLGLLCRLYRGQKYIPKNRPDVYKKCALMLFETWDQSRGIKVSLQIESHIRPTMEYLAYWIYTNNLRDGVTEDELIDKATEFLLTWKFDDRNEAKQVGIEFIRFCKGRAWVFTDTGTSKKGESLYQFTHTTFLEYFAALHLESTNYTPETLLKAMLPRIIKREWDVVAQLSFQIQSERIISASNKLLLPLVGKARKRLLSPSSFNALFFFCPVPGIYLPTTKYN